MTIITSKNVDLTNCDREQVQFSAAVQPHGCLLVVEEPSLGILQASANTGEVIGVPHDRICGQTLVDILGESVGEIAVRLEREPFDNGPVHLGSFPTAKTRSQRPLNVFAHRCGGATIFEFEVISPSASGRSPATISELTPMIGELRSVKTLQSFFDVAVAQVRAPSILVSNRI